MNRRNKLLLLLLPLFFSIVSLAQSPNYKLKSDSKASVTGTSTLHDWTGEVNEMEGSASFSKSIVKKLKAGETIEGIELKFKVASIDGGRGDTMNNKIVKAFGDDNPYIIFQSSEPAKITEVNDKTAGTFKIVSKGKLTMAGVSKDVEIELEGKKLDSGDFQFTGEKALKMSDYGMERPSAMFGQIVTGDDITAKFDLTFTKN
ncbi:YceI family protein [Flexithrix dorotheae]|uniref:YceI family protein n=1 Tax=Flexithrix dorotheae TaxID=70993 RepID=UPI0003800F2D|nr:YceI family protein [Flexithrix dorotheae]